MTPPELDDAFAWFENASGTQVNGEAKTVESGNSLNICITLNVP